jgi:transglutaminase-like putative cysteine protease
VFVNRRGVCQDFANLFICLARLMSVPARYAFGYVYTGPKHANQAQGEASHAWVQVYLPHLGWRGFDPTNGSIVQTDHVRVAVGRNFVDATPTSGTIYVGGGPERMTVDVSVKIVDGLTQNRGQGTGDRQRGMPELIACCRLPVARPLFLLSS